MVPVCLCVFFSMYILVHSTRSKGRCIRHFGKQPALHTGRRVVQRRPSASLDVLTPIGRAVRRSHIHVAQCFFAPWSLRKMTSLSKFVHTRTQALKHVQKNLSVIILVILCAWDAEGVVNCCSPSARAEWLVSILTDIDCAGFAHAVCTQPVAAWCRNVPPLITCLTRLAFKLLVHIWNALLGWIR